MKHAIFRKAEFKDNLLKFKIYISTALGNIRRMYACAIGLVAVAMRILLIGEIADPILVTAETFEATNFIIGVLGVFLTLHGLLAVIACFLPRQWAIRIAITSAVIAFFISIAVAVTAMYLDMGAIWIPYAACDMQTVGAALFLLLSVVDEDIF